MWLMIIITNIILYGQQNDFPSIHQIEHQLYKGTIRHPSIEKGVITAIPLQEKATIPSRTIFGYHPYWMNSAYPNYNYDLLSTIAYFGVDVNSEGYIVDYNGWPVTDLINLAHSNGVKVVLVAINFDSNSLTTLLSNSANRTCLINNLICEVKRANADGINIDFEQFPSSQKQNLNLFMLSLADTFHKYIPNSSVSIALPAVNWSNKFDYCTLATVCDAIFIMGYNYHWTGSSAAGPVAPLTGWGTYNITWTVNDYLSATQGQKEKIILGLPYYGISWPTCSSVRGASTTGSGSSLRYNSAETQAQAMGKLWDAESQTPWYRYQSGNWYQTWYDDSLSLSMKYQLVIEEELQGIGIWALGYDGDRPELWGALRELFGSNTSPMAVQDFHVQNIGGGIIRIKSSISPDATGYCVYIGTKRNQFRLRSILSQPLVTYSNLSADSTYLFKITAFNQYGESPASEVLAVTKAPFLADVLIVNGFDRLSVPGNTRDFVVEHGSAIKAAGYTFDSASNEAVSKGLVDLTKYKIVDWILGQESTADETFSIQEQQFVKDFLEQGGRLFVSGSEIGWDLDYKGTTTDKEFYQNYLKTRYVVDKVDQYNIYGTADGIFHDLNFSFDDGTNGIYCVSYPDGISPSGGSSVCLKYDNQYNAGIQYKGTIGAKETKIVNLGFPFETIYPESDRNQVMCQVLNFLDETTEVFANEEQTVHIPKRPVLYHNFPNPFNQSTIIKISLPNSEKISLKIFNLLGERVKTFYSDEFLLAGCYQVEWKGFSDSGKPLVSGVYFCRLEIDDFITTRQILFLK